MAAVVRLGLLYMEILAMANAISLFSSIKFSVTSLVRFPLKPANVREDLCRKPLQCSRKSFTYADALEPRSGE